MTKKSLCFCILFTYGSELVASFAPKSGWAHHYSRTPHLKMSIPNPLDTITSGLASICRFPKGVTVENNVKSGAILVQLFDVETSRECRIVRERISELDLVVRAVIPAAPNSRVFSVATYEHALPIGTEIPRLVVQDEAGREVVKVGQAEIISYLDETFSMSDAPDAESDNLKESVLNVAHAVGNYAACFLRLGRGSSVTSAALSAATPRPDLPLILYSYEGNQFCRLVREVLTDLDIVYELRSAGKLSPRREELAAITGGSSQCPFLIDPNTSVQMPESESIIRYLYKTYALWTPPNEILQLTSEFILPLVKPLFKILAPLQAGSSKEDKNEYEADLSKARIEIDREIASASVVIYTYSLSPFSSEAKALFDNLEIEYTEISLGSEWLPGLIAKGSSQKRAALLEMTGQSSLPHVFIGGKPIGGLFSGTPGIIPALEQGILIPMVNSARSTSVVDLPESALEEMGAFE